MEIVVFVPTGEVRAPKKGEWVLNNLGNYVPCLEDWTFPHPIQIRHVIPIPDVKKKEKKVIVRWLVPIRFAGTKYLTVASFDSERDANNDSRALGPAVRVEVEYEEDV
jgi:hypothetical protein